MKRVFVFLIIAFFYTIQTVEAYDSNIVNITTENGKKESLYFDDKGNLEKVENSQIEITEAPISSEYDAIFKDAIKKIPKELKNYKKILRMYDYGMRDKSDKNRNAYYSKLNLLDGDYAVLRQYHKHLDMPQDFSYGYIAEYHANGKLMGLVKINKVKLADNSYASVFYEYRIQNNSKTVMKLKHILFANTENENEQAAYSYIYNADSELLCCQIKNDIYISQKGRNMIPDLSKLSPPKQGHSHTDKLKDAAEITISWIVAPVVAPVALPICIYALYKFSKEIHF